MARRPDLSRLTSVVLAIGLVLVAAFWWQRSAVERGRAKLSEVALGVVRPMPLAGLRISINDFLDSPIDLGGSSAIIVIASDICPVCQDQLPEWEDVLKALPSSAPPFVFVSVNGRKIMDRLASVAASAGLRHQARRVIDLTGFIQATGVGWTPEIVVVDAGMTIRGLARRLGSDNVAMLLDEARGPVQ